jgi:hypothetical protein
MLDWTQVVRIVFSPDRLQRSSDLKSSRGIAETTGQWRAGSMRSAMRSLCGLRESSVPRWSSFTRPRIWRRTFWAGTVGWIACVSASATTTRNSTLRRFARISRHRRLRANSRFAAHSASKGEARRPIQGGGFYRRWLTRMDAAQRALQYAEPMATGRVWDPSGRIVREARGVLAEVAR